MPWAGGTADAGHHRPLPRLTRTGRREPTTSLEEPASMSQARADTDVLVKAIRLACTTAGHGGGSSVRRWSICSPTTAGWAPKTDPAVRRSSVAIRPSTTSGPRWAPGVGAPTSIAFPVPVSATIWLRSHPRPSVTRAQRDCAEAIVQRRTDSLPFRAPECWEDFEPSLRCSNPVWRPAASPSDVMQFRRSNRPRPEE